MLLPMKQTFLPALALTALLGPLSGCGGSNSTSSSGSDQSFRLNTDASNALSIATSGSVTCTDFGQCHPAVAMMTNISSENAVEECTSFLVDSDIMATNSHCIPADLKAANSACNNRIWVYFPQVGTQPALQVKCSQILTASDLGVSTGQVNPDYAFFRLERAVPRTPLPLSRDGFKNGESYTLLKVDPTSQSNAIGAMNSESCTARKSSSLIPKSGSDYSANMEIADCTVIHGNSGSPIVDSRNQVHGIIQAYFDDSAISLQLALNGVPQFESPGMLNLGTSFACLDAPVASFKAISIPDACKTLDTDTTNATQGLEQALTTKIKNDLDNLLLTSTTLDSTFQWDFISYKAGNSSTQQFFVTVPKCITDLKKLQSLKRSDSLNLSAPMASAQIGVDRYLVLQSQVQAAMLPATIDATWSPNDLRKNDQTVFTMSIRSANALIPMSYSANLSECK